ncbi:MAG: hypothetical protein JW969_17585 [Spirochaetales bacterium]|nr:hypothetical protein [Spirochaetales bacterium]
MLLGLYILIPVLRKYLAGSSRATLGVYFIHYIPMNLLARGTFGISLNPLSFQSLLAVPLLALTVYGASFLLINLLLKVSFLRRLIG